MIEGLNLSEVIHCSTLAGPEKYVPTIKVIGIGKCGIDAVDYMIEHGVKAAEYVAIDTDAKTLASCLAGEKLQISDWFLQSDSSAATLEQTAEQEIIKILIGYSNIVFIVLGMGESTGRHVAPLVAKIAQPMSQLLVAVVALPPDQNNKHIDCIDENLNLLSDNVHSLIVIPDNFDDTKISLHRAVAGIAELYMDEGLMPCDLWDAAINLTDAGMCLMGTASASGTDRAKIAAGKAIANLELQNVDMNLSRRKALVNITSSGSLQPHEVVTIMTRIKLSADASRSFICAGTTIDESMGHEIRVTIFEFLSDEQLGGLQTQDRRAVVHAAT
jgi:cell division protein FtsZ